MYLRVLWVFQLKLMNFYSWSVVNVTRATTSLYVWNCAVCGIGSTVALGSVSKLWKMLGSLDYNWKCLYLHKPSTNYAILNVNWQGTLCGQYKITLYYHAFFFPSLARNLLLVIIIYFFNKIRIILYKTYSILCII